MYMEAYGNVGSIADNIIKKVATAYVGNKVADEKIEKTKGPQWSENAISKDGVSPKSGGVGSMADPNTKMEMDKVSSQKARESLMSKIESLQGRNIYLQELADNRQKQIDTMNKDIGDINKALKGMIK